MESSVGRRSRPSRPRSADILVDEVTSQISQGECAPGDRLGSEADLIERFGLSRAVVREGLRILEREGLVTVKPGPSGGVFCARPDIRSLTRSIGIYGSFNDVTTEDLVEARMELEVVVTSLAAARATESDLIELERLNRVWMGLIGNGDTDAQARTNVQFHVALSRASHNPVFVAFIDALEDLLYETAVAPEYPDRRLDWVVYSHERVLEPIRRRDADGAAAAMRRHLETFRPNAWRTPQDTGDAVDGRPDADDGEG